MLKPFPLPDGELCAVGTPLGKRNLQPFVEGSRKKVFEGCIACEALPFTGVDEPSTAVPVRFVSERGKSKEK